MQNKRITVFGGTGFLGKATVSALLRLGYDVQAVSRHAMDCKDLMPAHNASTGRLLLKNADISQPKTLAGICEGSYAVVNLVGILYESGRQRFSSLHAQCPERLARLAQEAGVKRFIHVSALGVKKAHHSHYARSKVTGEQAVREIFPKATILRPSVIFGPEDNFINQFDQMAKCSPILPLIGGGKTQFQPIYVGDVAQAIATTIASDNHQGKDYDLGGDTVLSFQEILQTILRVTHRERVLLPLGWSLAGLIGTANSLLPKPLITKDQVRLLRYDNIVEGENGLDALGITPTPLEPTIARYLNVARHIPDVEKSAA